MSARVDREDLTVQREAAASAQHALIRAVMDVEDTAGDVRRRRADVTALYAAVEAVRRAEEARDLARLDLATAAGEDA